MDILKNYWNKWFPKPTPLSALDAYTITKYGVRLDKETLYAKAIEEISTLRQAKSARNSYTLIYDLDENIPELGEYLVEYYNGLKFNCFILDKTIDARIQFPQLYLSWNVSINIGIK